MDTEENTIGNDFNVEADPIQENSLEGRSEIQHNSIAEDEEVPEKKKDNDGEHNNGKEISA